MKRHGYEQVAVILAANIIPISVGDIYKK